jgi:hypothetical protein
VVGAATVWGHLLNFDGFGTTRDLLVAAVLVLVGGFTGFMRAERTRRLHG